MVPNIPTPEIIEGISFKPTQTDGISDWYLKLKMLTVNGFLVLCLKQNYSYILQRQIKYICCRKSLSPGVFITSTKLVKPHSHNHE